MNSVSTQPNQSLPNGTVSFLFTDIEGSTRLAMEHPLEMPALLSRHHAIIQEAIRAYDGVIFQTVGDGFCAAFHSAPQALNAAWTAQRRLQAEDWQPAPITARMGIHTGSAQVSLTEDQRSDYQGYLTLARAQGVMASAYGGQVLLSDASAGLLHGSLPEGVSLRDMGEQRIKGWQERQRLWQLLASDLRAEFPALKTLEAPPTNLPVQLNRFIGRERELMRTHELLTGTHLLTLIGPGGTGKTRLSLQLASETLGEFANGAWLVELASLADPGLVLPTVAAAVGVRELPGMALLDLLTDTLRSRRLLLVLDNCEHLVEACAELSEHLLRNCPNLKLIASSREALGIAGETVYRVPPLTLPILQGMKIEIMLRSESVQLFQERAAAAKPGFSITEQNAPAVAQICLRLDGIPLAIELAAARVALLSPQQIATRLDDRFRLLTGGSRTALPRQQTLRSLIDWSYDLLSEDERGLFSMLAVFVGGWSLEAAEAICPDLDVFTLLGQLVQKSLVVAEELEDGSETRFRLLETIRQYARDRLLESDSAVQARDRHLAYYVKHAESGELDFFGPKRLEWMDSCELELDNFRAAMQWGLDHDASAALRIASALTTFWGGRGLTTEGQRWIEAGLEALAALETSGDSSHESVPVRAKGLLSLSQMSYGLGNYEDGLEAVQEAVRLYRGLGDPFSLAFALSTQGNMAALQNDSASAEDALNEATQIGRELGIPVILSYSLGVLGHFVYLPRGDLVAARRANEESVQQSRLAGVPWAEAQGELIFTRISGLEGEWEAARVHAHKAQEISAGLRDPLLLNMVISMLGDIELGAGDLAEAVRCHTESILALQEIGQRAYVSHGLESFAFIARAKGQPERAARLLAAAEAVREGLSTSAIGVLRMQAEYTSTIAWLHERLDDENFDRLWSDGCGMSIDQAVAYALQQ